MTIAKGPKTRKGPDPELQDRIREVLEGMFDERDTWQQKECEARIREAGINASDPTIGKVRNNIGIRSVMIRNEDGKLVGMVLDYKEAYHRPDEMSLDTLIL